MMWTLLSPLALATAPVELVPEIQVRPRFEADSGRDGVDGAGTVAYVTQRSRLGATLSRDGLAVRVVVQDVRFFGEEGSTRRDFSADGLDVRIATATWSPGDWSFEVGRMERGLFNERLLAISAWRQPGRSLDGARIAWGHEGWSLDLRGHLLREGDSRDLVTTDQVLPTAENDRGLLVATAGRTTDTWSVHPTVFVDLDTTLDQRTQRATPGVYALLTPGDLRIEAEAWGQFGLTADITTTAAMAGVTATWAPVESASVGAGYAILSGDNDTTNAKNTAFYTLEGANHRYYGHIDMAMFKVGGFGDQQGLQDAQVLGRWSPHERLQLLVDLHVFLAAAPPPGADAFFAFEPDLEARVPLADGLVWSNGVFPWIPGGGDAVEWMAFSMFDARL